MDPLSIAAFALSTSKVLYSTSVGIYQFVQATHDFNRSILSLHSQINGLGGILQSLASTLERPCLKDSLEHEELWGQIRSSIESCNGTTRELRTKLDGVTVASNSAIKQAWWQFKLSSKENDIARLLAEMKTHSVNLQLALSIVNV